MAESCGEQTKADDAVGDHHVVEHGHFLLEELIALALHNKEFERAFERGFQLRRVPRFSDVFENGA